jgi:hypothetical protein
MEEIVKRRQPLAPHADKIGMALLDYACVTAERTASHDYRRLHRIAISNPQKMANPKIVDGSGTGLGKVPVQA